MTYTPFDILSGNQRCHMRTATFAHNEYQIHSKRSESFNRSGVLEDLIKQMEHETIQGFELPSDSHHSLLVEALMSCTGNIHLFHGCQNHSDCEQED
ncbi:unnamed protein product [Brugia timori]|uniref:Bm10903, isoform a n=2 Tax=Brugia TaxID=6278 RepID=A0A1I9G4S5_BRUMA|nr:Bm10903, isoform a [Brugia malayi]VDO48674.1 unnamed protein product [Brugia timori]